MGVCVAVHPLLDMQGMDFTTDKLRSLVRKWQSLIEAHVDVKTTDNFTLRLFCIAFTKKRVNQQKRTCYAQSSQIRQVNTLVSLSLITLSTDMHEHGNPYRCSIHEENHYVIILPNYDLFSNINVSPWFLILDPEENERDYG